MASIDNLIQELTKWDTNSSDIETARESNYSSEQKTPLDNFNYSFTAALASQQGDFWKEILSVMKEYGPYLNEDFGKGSGNFGTGTNSVLGYIQHLSDLDQGSNSLLTKIKNQLKGSNTWTNTLKNKIDLTQANGFKSNVGSPWNESVSKLIAHYLSSIDLSVLQTIENEENASITQDKAVYELGGIKTNGISNFRIQDIKNADAGYDFSQTWNKSNPWVKPWNNIDGDTYSSVRSSDIITEVISSNKDLQFTHKNSGEWIRLLMPKYLRYVEIEDLNRNFWVIGQTVAALCAYLFDEDAPIFKMLEGLLDEVVQIWENILYLWGLLSIISQKESPSLHTEVVIVPNDNITTIMKYDNFDTNLQLSYNSNNANRLLESIWNRIKYKKDEYSNSHLCLIPVIRTGNYFKNYYSGEIWPGAILYVVGDESPTYVPFIRNNSYFTLDLARTSTWMANLNIASYIGALKENGTKLKYFSPFSKVSEDEETDSSTYFGYIRTVPEVEASFDENNRKINLDNFTLTCYDMSRVATGQISGYFIKYIYNNDNNGFSAEMPSVNPLPNIKSNNDWQAGFYPGELISYWENTSEITYQIDFIPVNLAPIANSEKLGEDGDNTGITYSDLLNMSGYVEKLQKEHDVKALQIYARDQADNSGKFAFYVGRHNLDLFARPNDGDVDDLFKYYILNNNTLDYYEKDSDKTLKRIKYIDTATTNAITYKESENDQLKRWREYWYSSAILKTPFNEVISYQNYSFNFVHLPIWNGNIEYKYKDKNNMTQTAHIYADRFVLNPTNSDTRARHSYTKNYYYVYSDSKDRVVTKNTDWAVRYVQVSGNYLKYSNDEDVQSYQNPIITWDINNYSRLNGAYNSIAQDCYIEYDKTSTDNKTYKYTPIILTVKVHIFTKDGRYYAQEWKRYNPSENLIYSEIWQNSYQTYTKSSGGASKFYDQLYKDLNDKYLIATNSETLLNYEDYEIDPYVGNTNFTNDDSSAPLLPHPTDSGTAVTFKSLKTLLGGKQ